MNEITIRPATQSDRHALAELIHVSTNYWYRAGGRPAIFAGSPADTELFFDVYEALDPGCCLLAEIASTGRLAGSCFYHPRPTHVSLGIMNAHPAYFGHGVASRLLRAITDIADAQGKPVRLVSSAMNLDSFSLYTRAGFVPRTVFQDMILPVPPEGLSWRAAERARVREATLADVPRMAALEQKLSGISREKDYRHFMENAAGIWHASLLEAAGGALQGFLVSVRHPGSHMLGPGAMADWQTAAALIAAELDHHRGGRPVFLVPASQPRLVAELYAHGARNCELHFAQVRGPWREPDGVQMPTFMPETG